MGAGHEPSRLRSLAPGFFVGAPKWHPIENEIGGGGLALGGRHDYYIHNNQINDGVGGGGRIREEMRTGGTRGGWRSLVGAAFELNDEKNRETGEQLALNGRH